MNEFGRALIIFYYFVEKRFNINKFLCQCKHSVNKNILYVLTLGFSFPFPETLLHFRINSIYFYLDY